jgi:hypothetical protein
MSNGVEVELTTTDYAAPADPTDWSDNTERWTGTTGTQDETETRRNTAEQ